MFSCMHFSLHVFWVQGLLPLWFLEPALVQASLLHAPPTATLQHALGWGNWFAPMLGACFWACGICYAHVEVGSVWCSMFSLHRVVE